MFGEKLRFFIVGSLVGIYSYVKASQMEEKSHILLTLGFFMVYAAIRFPGNRVDHALFTGFGLVCGMMFANITSKIFLVNFDKGSDEQQSDFSLEL
jgi:cellobiose-specific phosphotransferase system component IIC